MSNLYQETYNPDVLLCLANLSNDEIFTPPDVVNKMLDMLPKELFESPDTQFLDPACKSGVFLREIAKRLIIGLEDVIPDMQERVDHIMHKQLYGISITELTSFLSRRSLYCSKYSNSPFSVSHFDDVYGNILYHQCKHTWNSGKCVFCGASQNEYDRDNTLETHAYELIHTTRPEEIFNMKFDVICGNPPYQLSDGGNESSAKPIYNLFIEQAKKLKPRYLTMIIPSRWMQAGKGLDNFRKEMINDTRIKNIFDYENAKDCFQGINLDGGVCYFLWDSSYNGPVNYTLTTFNGDVITSKRYLKTEISSTVIRDSRQISIIEKVANRKEASFSSIVSSRKPYGIAKDLFNSPSRYPGANLSENEFTGSYKIFGVKGHKGGAKRKVGYISKSIIADDYSINKYKLFFTTSYSSNAVIPPETISANPNEICTETFLSIGPFNTKEERDNCNAYIHTTFFRALLYFRRGSMQVTKSVFEFIPIQDWKIKWTDEKLYEKYNLTQQEIAFIESMIKPMELEGE